MSYQPGMLVDFLASGYTIEPGCNVNHRDAWRPAIVVDVEEDSEMGEFSLLLRPIGESVEHQEWVNFPAHKGRVSKFLSRSREMSIG